MGTTRRGRRGDLLAVRPAHRTRRTVGPRPQRPHRPAHRARAPRMQPLGRWSEATRPTDHRGFPRPASRPGLVSERIAPRVEVDRDDRPRPVRFHATRLREAHSPLPCESAAFATLFAAAYDANHVANKHDWPTVPPTLWGVGRKFTAASRGDISPAHFYMGKISGVDRGETVAAQRISRCSAGLKVVANQRHWGFEYCCSAT